MARTHNPSVEPNAKSRREGCCTHVSDWAWRGPHAKPTAGERSSLPEAEKQHDDSTVERIKRLPSSIGVVLMAAGVAGIILPGPFGTPLLIAGGLVLAPSMFDRLDAAMKSRFPDLRHHGVKIVERFLDDLQKRYPDEPPSGG